MKQQNNRVTKLHNGPSGNTANTDSELYAPSIHARPGPTAIGSGSRNASISLAQRQQERREKEKAVLKEVESQKKAVLEKLNNI